MSGDGTPELIETVLRLPDVQDLAAELSELGLDQLLDEIVDNDAVTALPLLGWAVKVTRGALGLREARHARKLLAFLTAIEPPDAETLAAWRERVRTEKDLRETGDRVLAVTETLVSTFQAHVVGLVFRRYLDGVCDAATLRRTVEMIGRVLTDDLRALTGAGGPDGLAPDVQARLIAAGLLVANEQRRVTQGSGPPSLSAGGRLVRGV